MKRVGLLIGLVCLLALAGCDGSDGRGSPDSDATPDDARAMRWWNALTPEQMVAALYGDEATAEQTVAAQKMYADLDDDTKALVNAATDEFIPLIGRGRHGIGTTLEYVRVNEDSTTEPYEIAEYTGYRMHRGRDALVVTHSFSADLDFPCSTAYWDLATGNIMACLDEDGEVSAEWIPHNGHVALPMSVGTRAPWEYGFFQAGSEFCDEICEGLTETWTVEECGIELEVAAGLFTSADNQPPQAGPQRTNSNGLYGTTL